eukprot:gene266-81_t
MTSPTKHGKDEGAKGLGPKHDFWGCPVAEYVWVDADNNTRSKTKTLSCVPTCVDDLPMWNFDGSSTEQAKGEDSEIYLVPRAMFRDPFRGGDNILVMAECVTPKMEPAIGNHRARCAELMEQYDHLDPWFGIEQEYTLMTASAVGEKSTVPKGFNADGSEPAAQGPYYCGAGCGLAIGRDIVDDHFARCLYAGIKISGMNGE